MILCDICFKNKVLNDGDICVDCKKLLEKREAKKDVHGIYLPDDLFERFTQLHTDVVNEEMDSKKKMSEFLSKFGTSFINKFTGKEINDPTPKVIIPEERTLDRIQKILNHNLAVYAKDNGLETPESLDDWSVEGDLGEDFETSILQVVDNIKVMESDQLEQVSDSVSPADQETPADPAPGQDEIVE